MLATYKQFPAFGLFFFRSSKLPSGHQTEAQIWAILSWHMSLDGDPKWCRQPFVMIVRTKFWATSPNMEYHTTWICILFDKPCGLQTHFLHRPGKIQSDQQREGNIVEMHRCMFYTCICIHICLLWTWYWNCSNTQVCLENHPNVWGDQKSMPYQSWISHKTITSYSPAIKHGTGKSSVHGSLSL